MSSGSSEDAVTEVLGQVLTFGILAVLAIGTVLAFQPLRERAEERAGAYEASSVADRVAVAVAQVATMAQQGATQARLELDLPETIAGHPYQITLEGAAVRVEVDGLGRVERASTLGAQNLALADVAADGVCAHTLHGGRIAVGFGSGMPDARLDTDDAPEDAFAATSCGATTIHMESLA